MKNRGDRVHDWPRRRLVAVVVFILAQAVHASRPVHAQSFSSGANFTTINRNQNTAVSGFIIEPPDTMGAAGPNHFIEFQNGSFSIYTKTGGLVSQISDSTFWTNAIGSDQGDLTDPRILYDPLSQRWFATELTTSQTANNKILVARSNTSDPSQGFKGVSYTTTNNRFGDFDTLGLDANGVYVGTNNFNGNSFSSLAIYSVPKADLLTATPSLARLTTSHNAVSRNTYGFTFQPAVDYGPKLATDPEPIMSTPNANSFSQYKFAKLTGTTGAGATLSGVTNRTVTSVSTPSSSSQSGTADTLDNGDTRISGNVVQLGNYLYSVLSTPVSGRTAVRWTIANATTLAIVQQGTISDSNLSYFYPSIAVNAVGDVVVGFSGSSSSTYASTYAVAGISAGGAPGGSLTFGTPLLTKAGIDYYPYDPGETSSRWGDFSATTPDPADPGIFWSHQEFATTKFANGGDTYGNWATQATEIIPTKPGERRWSNAGGGAFNSAGNYFTAAAPLATDHVIFSRASTSYTVTFTAANTSNRASVRQGYVTWNLAGGSYSLTNAGAAAPSLAVAEFQGTASLSVTGGALTTVNAAIASAAGGNGTVSLGTGASWINTNSISVGPAGVGTLNIQVGSTLDAGSALNIGATGTVNLSGGALRLNSYSRAAGGTVMFTAGKLDLTGDRTIGSDAAIQDFFGVSPSIGPGKSLVVEGNATLASPASLTMAGGTLSAASLAIQSGRQLLATQSSQVNAPVQALAGSLIEVVGGNLTVGDATSASGFYSNGTINVHANQLTLQDPNDAVLDSSAQVILGAPGAAGTLSAANGLTMNSGGQIAGYGVVNTPNDPGRPFVHNGTITGNSLAEPLSLSGYVKGTGTMDNVQLTGAYSPGAGPASVTLGSVIYAGSLEMELGGHTAGTEYDQLNHTLGSGESHLGGALDVSLINGFMPAAGDVFQIISAPGGVFGTFASSMLPALSGNLFWTVDYQTNSVFLDVSAPALSGDFNGDGVVDSADYVFWRKTDGTQFTYDLWRTHFGETKLDTNAAGLFSGQRSTAVAAPEPKSLLFLLTAVIMGMSGGTAPRVAITKRFAEPV